MHAEAVFTRLSLVYGKRFIESLGGVDPAMARATWAHELKGYTTEAIAYGMANLPQSFVPNVLQFAATCRQYTPPPKPALPGPKANPAVVERAMRALNGAAARMQRNGTDPKVWARKLQKRHEHGEKLTRFQVDSYRAVLGISGLQQGEKEGSDHGAVDGETRAA